MYSCDLKLGPAAILNQNPFFEMASSLIGQPNIYLQEKGQTN